MENITPSTGNNYLLENNQPLISALRAIIQQSDDSGFFLLGRIKNFPKLKHKFGDDVNDLVGEIVNRLSLAYPQYICHSINDKYFYVTVTHIDKYELEALAEDIQKVVESQSYTFHKINLIVTFGIAIFPEDSSVAEEIFTKAHLALKSISTYDERGYLFFHEFIEHQSLLLNSKNLFKKIKSAMRDNQIFLVFQPVLDGLTRRILYHECMLKMQGDDDLLAVDDYIAVAEKFGFIKFIDELVLDLVVQELQKYDDICLTVNVSSFVLNNKTWLEKATQLLQNPKISGRLGIEISEKILHKEMQQSIKLIKALHQLGCKILIDNYGFGHTSFAQLKTLPIYMIKIDGYFIQEILSNYNSEFFIKSIITMGQLLKTLVAAESVESEEVAQKLVSLGINELQGVYLGKPTADPYWRHKL